MSYRDDLAALDARVAALEHELAQTKQLQAEARRLVRENVIEGTLATPCTALWSEMTGDDRARHCGKCNKYVYNFAALTGDELEALIREKEGKLCGRFFIRADGTVLTKDCTRDVRIRPTRLAVALGVGAAAASALLAAGAVAKEMTPDHPQDGVDVTTGGLELALPPVEDLGVSGAGAASWSIDKGEISGGVSFSETWMAPGVPRR
jgi:hypothetical protein